MRIWKLLCCACPAILLLWLLALQTSLPAVGARAATGSPVYTLTAVLTNSLGAANDELATAVAISADGSTIVAGAPQVQSKKGALYVYVRSGSQWVNRSSPNAILTNSGAAANDQLGISVAISADGETIVAGAPGVGAKGAAYVYVKPPGGWANTANATAALVNSGGAANDELGRSIALSADGTTLVAGAPNVGAKGAAYVYVKPGGGWVNTSNATAALVNGSGAANSLLGFSVATNGDGSLAAAGAPGVISGTGAVYLFVRPGNTWANTSTPSASLSNALGAHADELGFALALSSDGATLAAGAPNVQISRGAAYIFVKPGGGWATTAAATAILSDAGGQVNDALGLAVALRPDGSTLVAGVPQTNDQGKAAVFARAGSTWSNNDTPTATLTNPQGGSTDTLGFAVGINADGSTIVAGAPRADVNKGAAEVFLGPGSAVLYLPLVVR